MKTNENAAAPSVSENSTEAGKKKSRTPGNFLIVSLLTENKNPTNPTKGRHGNYEIWLAAARKGKAISVEKYREASPAGMFDLLDAVKLGRARLVSPEEFEKIHSLSAPAAPKEKAKKSSEKAPAAKKKTEEAKA